MDRNISIPDPEGPQRLAREICAALARLPFVRAVTLFGSLADGRADRWSDVDMLVACEDVERTCWLAAGAIRSAKPVLFYRVFTLAEQPAGRYWFADECPFHKVDVSFHSAAEHQVGYRETRRLGTGIALLEMPLPERREPAAHPTVLPAPCLEIGDQESRVGAEIRRVQDSLKAFLRGSEEPSVCLAKVDVLRSLLAQAGADAAGGRMVALGNALLRWAGEVVRSRHLPPVVARG